MRRFIFLVLVAALISAAYLRWERGAGVFSWRREKFTPAAAPVLDQKDVPVMTALDAEYTKLVQAVVPSVVSIATKRRVQVRLVDPFELFFGGRRIAERTENALGSGVVVSSEGHILTNHHVIANVDEIRVQFTDGRVLPAELVGSNEAVDIAVLRVSSPNLKPLPLGDSDQVRVGQMVFAVGNPFGLQESVTRGIVSAKGRALHDSGVQFLQTDAAVNPGNSGGPLLNLRGEIIGINSSIYSQTGGWAGISFAIPSNTARITLEGLIKNGRAPSGYLGVNAWDLNPALANQLGFHDLQGALVVDVVSGSPAERAGLKRGDLVRTFNGQQTPNAVTLMRQIAAAAVGSSVKLGIVRAGVEQELAAEIGELPTVSGFTPQTPRPAPKPGQPEPVPNPPSPASLDNVLAGIEVGEIPSSLRDGLPPNLQGVVIKQLQPNSPAAERLRVGDIIGEINGRAVRSPDDFEGAARTVAPGDRVVLYVTRGQTRFFVVIAP